MKRILIAVPTYETITPDTFRSIYGMDKAGCECEFDFVRGYDCAAARNNIAQMALDRNADYVFMIDNDIVVPPDALKNLLEGDPDVCLGYCPARNSANVYDGKTAMYRMGEFDYTDQLHAAELSALASSQVNRLQLHGGGAAIALIKTDVFRRLPYPWFCWVNYQNRSVLSEDLYFCERCGEAGIKIEVDTRVSCGHLLRRMQWCV